MANSTIKCLIPTPKIKELINKSKENDIEGQYRDFKEPDFLILIEAWQVRNGKTIDDLPTSEELYKFYLDSMAKAFAFDSYPNGKYDASDVFGEILNESLITYTPIGKETQTYSVRGSHIYNKDGVEVFKEKSKDRNKIFANVAIKEGRAVVVNYRGTNYVVNDKGAIMSTSKTGGGDIMNWPYNNKNRIDIINLANQRFKEKNLTPLGQQRESNEKINIYYGSNENADLSNFAIRPFEYKGENFQSVEQAFQRAKFRYLKGDSGTRINNDELKSIKNSIMQTTNGKTLRSLGRRIPIDRVRWDSESSDVMKEIITESFKQNPDALNKLLATGNATLTHNQDDSKWKTEFPRILMEVRSELSGTETKKEQSNPQSYRALDTIANLAGYEKYSPDLVFKNSRQRRDRAALIARLFTSSANKLYKRELANLKELANSGNSTAAERLESLDRDSFVQQNVIAILNDVESMFDENKTTPEFLSKVNRARNKNWTDAQCLEYANQMSPIFSTEYGKIRNAWINLLQEAIPIIKVTENLNIDLYNGIANRDIVNNEGDNDNDSDDDNNDGDSERDYKEGWMIKARNVNERDTLSVRVRKLINSIKKVDINGKLETDDLGFARYIEPDYAHNILMNIVSTKVDKPWELIPALENASKNYRWISQVVNTIKSLDNDSDEVKKKKDSLKKQFYSNFQKQFNQYSIEVEKKNDDSTVTFKTIPINLRANIQFVINSWRDHIESGVQLDELSIYNREEGPELDPKTSKARDDFFTGIDNRFSNTRGIQNRSKAEIFLDNDQNVKDLHRLTKILGIEIPVEDMVLSLREENNLKEFLDNTRIILSKLKTDVKSYTNENGYLVYDDMLNSFGTATRRIAQTLNYIPSSAVMGTFRENGKSYQSYTPPSYAGKTIRNLKSWNKQFIQEQYKDVAWFYSDGQWHNDWLEKMENSSEARDKFAIKTVLHSNKKEFNDWDKNRYSLSMFQEFISDPTKATAWYAFPLEADVESADYVRFYRYSNDQCLDKMVETVLQEWKRIQLVLRRQDDPSIKKIAYFDIIKDKNGNPKGVEVDKDGNIISREDGAEFKFFPQLNTKKIEINGQSISFRDYLDDALTSQNPDMSAIKATIKTALAEIQKEKNESAWKSFKDCGILEKIEGKDKYKFFPQYKEDDIHKVFDNFMYNYSHAYTQMVEIFTTDLAYYKNLNDFQKRFKEVYAMTIKPYYEQNDDKINNIILADREVESNVKNEIFEIVDSQVAAGNMSKDEASYIKNTFSKKINVTDGQAFRTLKSFKKMLESLGEWTDEMETAYNNIRSGNYTQEDQKVMFQTVKPFVFTQNVQDSHIDNIKIKKPIQFKNSEALLLTLFGPQSKSPKLRALIKFAEDNDIDVIQFSSAGKVGNQGVIDYDGQDFNTEEEYIDFLNKSIKNPDGSVNYEVVHQVDMEDWGIVAANPEHLLDADVLFGTQIRKLAIADLGENEAFKVEGYDRLLSKEDVVREYSKLITARALKGFKEVYEELSDIEQLEKTLQKELNSNSRYDESLKEACKLVDDGNGGKMFNIPLYDPIQGIRVQNLINSIIKRKTVKHKIKGGSTTQASSYGVDNTINIRFFNSLGQFIFNEKEWSGLEQVNKEYAKLLRDKKKEFHNDFNAYKKANKAASEAYWEVYIPVWDSRLYDICYDEETKKLDINKLPNNLRYGVIERIPTEDKYSMQRIYVKDFLPGNTGSQLLLPADITAIVGADFDVDHNYDMMFDFDYFFDENQDKWIVKKSKLNKDKSYIENSVGALNNQMLNIITGILTNPAVAGRMVNPGNFDENKRVMYLLSILKNVDTKTFETEILPNKNDMSFLKKKAALYSGRLDPTNPMTQIGFHVANSTGGKMIGIYANNNGNHSIMQYTKLSLTQPITINGREYQSLHDSKVTDENGKVLFYISKQLASFLAASVDNVKEPTLSAFNQNEFTTSVTCLLLRLGVPTETIGLLLNQPGILKATERYLNNVDRGKDAQSIIEDTIRDFKISGNAEERERLSKLNNEDLIDGILLGHKTDMSDKEIERYNSIQHMALLKFSELFDLGNHLNTITQAFRADTSNGSNGPDIADTIIRQTRLDTIESFKDIDNIPQLPGYRMMQKFSNNDNDFNKFDYTEMFNTVINGDIPMIDAFTSASLMGSTAIIRKYFPQYKEDVMQAYSDFMSLIKPGTILPKKTINKFYEHLFLYSIMGLDSVSSMETVDGEVFNAVRTRNFFTNKFPFEFEKLKAKNEELRNNEFIKTLSIHKATKKDNEDRIDFKNVGSLSTTQRGQMMKDWESLLFSSDPIVSNVSLDLFRYCLYKQGLNFGPKSFIHLTPPSIRQAYPDYMERIRNIMNRDDDYKQFVNQFIRNNIFDTQLVPVVSPESSFKFDEKGTPLKNVSLSINNSSRRVDKNIAVTTRFVVTQKYPDGIFIVEPHPFISTKVNDNVEFYALSDAHMSNDKKTWTGNYIKIDPLNGFEYEYGVDAINIITVSSKEQIWSQQAIRREEQEEGKKTELERVENETQYMIDNGISTAGDITDLFDADDITSYPAERREDATGKNPC